MNCKITVQPTPNPSALKFVLDQPVKTRDSAVYKTGADASANPLAHALLSLGHVMEVYFANNFITITQDGKADWDELEKDVQTTISKLFSNHNPDFEQESVNKPLAPTADLARIESILDSTIRPALQRDGGDLQLLALNGKVLIIRYEGACGCCPHAAMGTLYAIQNILKDQFDPEIVVEMA